ncbi:DUF2336 domain-containing protein [Caulobacter segnis]
MIDRHSLPVDLLNEMYFVVEARCASGSWRRTPASIRPPMEAALAAGRKRVATQDGALPPDHAEAEAEFRTLRARSQVSPQMLANMLRGKKTTLFLVALADMAGVDFHTARRILERREMDALSVICKAADFDRSLFLTFALLILEPTDDVMLKAKTYGETLRGPAAQVGPAHDPLLAPAPPDGRRGGGLTFYSIPTSSS